MLIVQEILSLALINLWKVEIVGSISQRLILKLILVSHSLRYFVKLLCQIGRWQIGLARWIGKYFSPPIVLSPESVLSHWKVPRQWVMLNLVLICFVLDTIELLRFSRLRLVVFLTLAYFWNWTTYRRRVLTLAHFWNWTTYRRRVLKLAFFGNRLKNGLPYRVTHIYILLLSW